MSQQEYAEFVEHAEFRAGLPAGQFRVIVNPKLAWKYVQQRLLLMFVMLPVLGIGIALALTGRVWAGGVLIAVGIIANRVIKAQAGNIVLHLAQKDPRVYYAVTQAGVMEVRMAERG